MRKKLLIIFILFSQFLVGQQVVVKGLIIDQYNKEPIEYATISIHSAIDSTLMYGSISDADGSFEISILDSIPFYVSIQFIGYGSFTTTNNEYKENIDLGVIGLSLIQTTLTDIEIRGRAITSLHKIDKQIYSARQFGNAQGGSASDVLKNLPSISVNSFGEIAVRGANGFLVMVNGKPLQGDPMNILQRMSANSIEDIEIVTAPSAKYDPDGHAGIINIITSNTIRDGMYFTGQVLLGSPSIQPYQNFNHPKRYGADFIYNYQKGKWNLSLGADYKRYDITGRREGYVNTYIGEMLTEFPSDGERSFDEENYSGRMGLKYTPSDRESFTLGLYGGKRTKERTADILYLNQQRSEVTEGDFVTPGAYYQLYQQTGSVLNSDRIINRRTFFNENLRVRKSDFFITSLDYGLDFKNNGKLNVSFLYERTILGGPTDNVSLSYPDTDNVRQLQFNTNDNPLDGYRFQLDYNHDFGGIKLEGGYQFRYLNHPGDFDYFDRDLVNDIWISNPLFTNGIKLNRRIHGLYSQVKGGKGRLKYTVGLRLENFNRTVEIESPQSVFLLNQWNIFPSINIGYEVSEGFRLKAGYSRRIERTTTFKMTPFPEREHSETLEQGDAELLPEYIDVIEAGLVKTWGDNSVFATCYYRDVANVINRVNTIHNDTILNRIYTNVGNAQALGVEVGTTIYPLEKWRFYVGGNIFRYKIAGSLFNLPVNTSNTIFTMNANTNYKFSSTFDVQLAFNYLSERVTAQGSDSEFYNPSLTLRKSILNEKANIAIQWLNIDMGLWGANEQRITTEQADFFTTTNYVYEVDIIQVSFTYKLNQPLKNVKLPDSEFGKKEF